jgi:hypothetical protein
MKKIYLIILIILLVGKVYTQDDQTLIIQPGNPTSSGKLYLEHPRGTVTVNGYDGQVVIISAAKNVPIRAIEDNNRVTVISESGDHAVDVEIRLPYSWSLDIVNQADGDVFVNNMSGELVIDNAGGAIYLNNVSGAAVLATLDGLIRARFTDIPSGQPMAFSSMDGTIDLTFPNDLDAIIKLKTEHGQVISDFDLSTDRDLNNHNENQMGWIYANQSGGGSQIVLSTYNGDIILNRSL